MQNMIGQMLKEKITGAFELREGQVNRRLEQLAKALEKEDRDAVYRRLSELAGLTEKLCKDLREAMEEFFSSLQAVGFCPYFHSYSHGGEVKAFLEDGRLRLEMPGILPVPTRGSVYYLHEQVRWALEDLIRERKLSRPIFNGRCAVIFVHRYKPRQGSARYLRDYDNVEHRCVTNALTGLAIWGDSPECMIGMDILAAGDHDYTEILVMPVGQFRGFVMSEKFDIAEV